MQAAAQLAHVPEHRPLLQALGAELLRIQAEIRQLTLPLLSKQLLSSDFKAIFEPPRGFKSTKRIEF